MVNTEKYERFEWDEEAFNIITLPIACIGLGLWNIYDKFGTF
jgi:hypothetical protein